MKRIVRDFGLGIGDGVLSRCKFAFRKRPRFSGGLRVPVTGTTKRNSESGAGVSFVCVCRFLGVLHLNAGAPLVAVAE